MKITPTNTSISKTVVDAMLWSVQRYLMARYGVDQAERDVAPLVWWIETGRASVDFIRAFVMAKPYMIGRKLHQGGSYQEAVKRIKNYLMTDNSEY